MATSASRGSKIQGSRRERIEARLTSEQKALISRAAELEGMSVSSFMVQRAVDSAARSIERHDLVRLSVGDSKRIADALLNPPEPTDALRKAVDRYRQVQDR